MAEVKDYSLDYISGRRFAEFTAGEPGRRPATEEMLVAGVPRAPFSARHRADLERWAAEGSEVARLMLETGMPFDEALAELHARLPGPAPVPDPDEE
jgi:hypothetical protein